MKFDVETVCIHGNERIEYPYGSLSVPIFQAATFTHPGIGESTGYDYTRESNPTRTELERIMNALEGGVDTVACNTGMAAIALAFELLPPESHVVCSEDLYGGSVRYFDTMGERKGLHFTYVDTSDIQNIKDALQDNTKALYIETPSNPTMQITDLRKVKELAVEKDLLLYVDNTFLTPYFQKPIALGADVVISSGTKFLSGHNDTLAGFITVADKKHAEQIRYAYKTIGCCLSPFDSYMLVRGIKTLALRMERAQENAEKIALWLQEQPHVAKVYYVGLKDHPGYEVNKSQCSGYGSMISFRVDTEERARKMLEKVKVIAYAESLGGVESLMTYPMLQTHGDVPVEQREKLGITETFLRLSVGVESVGDLINDLEQALSD
ncbi:MAG: PLP-dependent transferase [Lachnospiraceae bacterium]|nr:PLP-dependent transferase [Lachnospiraceae bacterium]